MIAVDVLFFIVDTGLCYVCSVFFF
uniref:Uncharacterized protein n=1 Tax=Anguilla anguilla TaxID=7936 RepID=A0A0E9TUC3_ANGAN